MLYSNPASRPLNVAGDAHHVGDRHVDMEHMVHHDVHEFRTSRTRILAEFLDMPDVPSAILTKR